MTSKAEELWEKYGNHFVDGGGYATKAEFLAALREYGAEVRKRDAEVCLTFGHESWPDQIAYAIEREELP